MKCLLGWFLITWWIWVIGIIHAIFRIQRDGWRVLWSDLAGYVVMVVVIFAIMAGVLYGVNILNHCYGH